MRVSVGGHNCDNAVSDLNDGDVEGSAAQIVHHDLLLFLIVQAIGQSSCRGLVDDALYLQTGDLARVLGGLTLCVVEICGNRDHGLRDLLPQIALRVRFQLLQNHGRNLLGRILLSVNGTAVVRSHVPFDGGDGLLRIGDCLTLGRLAHKPLPCLCKSYNGRCGSGPLRIRDDGGLAALHNRHAAVCRTQIDTYDLAHFYVLLRFVLAFIFQFIITCLLSPSALAGSGIPISHDTTATMECLTTLSR